MKQGEAGLRKPVPPVVSAVAFAGQVDPKAWASRSRRAFRAVFVAAIGVIPPILAVCYAMVMGQWQYALPGLLFGGVGFATWFCIARGRLEGGFRLAICGTWLALLVVVCLFNGLRSPALAGFCLILCLAGWFAGLRSAVLLTVATLCVYGLLAFAGAIGSPLPAALQAPIWYAALVHGFIAAAAGALGYYAAKSLSAQMQAEHDSRAHLHASLAALEIREQELSGAQELLRQANLDLEQRATDRTAQLEGALRELEAFSYSVSHDLRTPLRAINGQSSLLLEEETTLSSTAQRRLGAIAKSADHMGKMVDTLLVVVRLSRTEIRREPIHMQNLATNSIAPFRAKYPSAQVEIGAMPITQADAALVRKLWEVLIDNAFRYSAGRPKQRVEAGWDAHHNAWFVRDNGIGFDMRYAHRLWGLFERLQAPEQAQGMGTGLAVANRIVERHGGDIWAQAAPDQGATFFFTLAPAGAEIPQ